MNPDARYSQRPWALPRGKPLTDKKIASYQARGYYSPEFREARKAHANKLKARRLKGDHFFETEDGRLIYSIG